MLSMAASLCVAVVHMGLRLLLAGRYDPGDTAVTFARVLACPLYAAWVVKGYTTPPPLYLQSSTVLGGA